ncbi:hypothetical protein CRYUN_Cryun39dG0011900 [Craigia yunnanensis]
MLHIRLGKQICHEVECTDVKLGYCNWWIPSPYLPLCSLIDGAKTLGILVLLLITSFFPQDVANTANLSSSSSSVTQLCSHDEAAALIQFKSSFSIYPYPRYCNYISDIISYPKTDSWNEGTDCCSWDGVTCDNIKGQVIGLDLSCSFLYGTIPSNSSLFLLSHLQKLNLAFNDFNHSKMSSKFGKFASLSRWLWFARKIPRKHFSPAKTQDAQFRTKCNPQSQSSQVELEQPSRIFGSLIFPFVRINSKFIGEPLTTDGHIPSSLTNLKQLELLNLGDNLLEGSIPDEVSAFPNLNCLGLFSNLLNGTLPSWLYTTSSLEYIYLSDNQFSGHIKEFQYNSLRWIDLRNNKLQGPIPSSISQLLNLTLLALSSNNLSGIVEYGMFSKLQKLHHLTLSSNSLSLNSNGTSVDYTLSNLEYLGLSSCNVSKFPQFLRGSKGLQALDLSDNRIYGKIPKWIRDVGKDSLSALNLSHNSFTDFEQLPKDIRFLDLSSNLIHGDLPIPPLKTDVFIISNNSLSGQISSLICNLSSLELLDLSHNNLNGTIPQCFGNLSKAFFF